MQFSKKKVAVIFVVSLLILAGITVMSGFKHYSRIYDDNVSKETAYQLTISSNFNFDSVLLHLTSDSVLLNYDNFEWVVEKMNYRNHVKPGIYELKPGMNNREIVRMLRSGMPPVRLIFNSLRTKEDLVKIIGEQLEMSPSNLLSLLNDKNYVSEKGLTIENVVSVFIPNTYEVYWDTKPRDLIDRMIEEHAKFWSKKRSAKAESVALTPLEVATLASIVEQEYKFADEAPRIAGVYLNRLQRGMKLDADPTLIFALGDFTLKRVLNKHKKIDSPYNTYKNKGLPPGPICLPSITTIDAVLNAENHEYIFFCAKADFSGYHNFSKSYRQHKIYARQYQAELKKLN